MRILRIPYYYISVGMVRGMHAKLHAAIRVVHDIHNDIPNINNDNEIARTYLYHASFLRWAHDKVAQEMVARGFNHQSPLPEEYLKLRSRRISEILPPTDDEIAQEAIILLEMYRKPGRFGRIKLPHSYVELAEQFYGYTPSEASLQGVDSVSGHHRDNDAGWYSV